MDVSHAPHSLLDRDQLPMKLWEKAQVHGSWNPARFNFDEDRRDWAGLASARRQCIIEICSLFLRGEAAVTTNVLPLIFVASCKGRTEEELYLTSFLHDEAKHVDFFDRWFREVVPEQTQPQGASPHPILDGELQRTLNRLWTDRSIEAEVSAALTYHLVVEGVMAETGYNVFTKMLHQLRSLPSLKEGLEHIRQDESRHIAYGVYVLRRLFRDGGRTAEKALMARLAELKPLIEQATDHLGQFAPEILGTSIQDLTRLTRQRFAGRVQMIVGSNRRSL
jgi:ribonucleoside-diphosphate reductase beta chain